MYTNVIDVHIPINNFIIIRQVAQDNLVTTDNNKLFKIARIENKITNSID